MGAMRQAVQDGIGEGGLTQSLVPERDWKLAGDDGRPALNPVYRLRSVVDLP